MTVGKLIELLETMPRNLPILISSGKASQDRGFYTPCFKLESVDSEPMSYISWVNDPVVEALPTTPESPNGERWKPCVLLHPECPKDK